MKAIHLSCVMAVVAALAACSKNHNSGNPGINSNVVIQQQTGGVCPQISGQYLCKPTGDRADHDGDGRDWRRGRDHQVKEQVMQPRTILIGQDGSGRAVLQDGNQWFYADGQVHPVATKAGDANYRVTCDNDSITVQVSRAQRPERQWTYKKRPHGLVIRTRVERGESVDRCIFRQN